MGDEGGSCMTSNATPISAGRMFRHRRKVHQRAEPSVCYVEA
jgi:hypothetical protein